MTCGIHQNDIGTEIQVKIVNCDGVAVDISAADLKQIVFKLPGGSSLVKTADFVTPGVNGGKDGLIKYVIGAGDLSEVGTWKLQGVVTVGSYVWHSNFESFKVLRNLS